MSPSGPVRGGRAALRARARSHAWTVEGIEKDTRKEVWFLIKRLDPRRRIQFLMWACKQATTAFGTEIRVTDHTGTTEETYRDLMHMEFAFGLDLEKAALALVQLVRKEG